MWHVQINNFFKKIKYDFSVANKFDNDQINNFLKRKYDFSVANKLVNDQWL